MHKRGRGELCVWVLMSEVQRCNARCGDWRAWSYQRKSGKNVANRLLMMKYIPFKPSKPTTTVPARFCHVCTLQQLTGPSTAVGPTTSWSVEVFCKNIANTFRLKKVVSGRFPASNLNKGDPSGSICLTFDSKSPLSAPASKEPCGRPTAAAGRTRKPNE